MSFSHTISKSFFFAVILLLAGEVHSEAPVVVEEAVSFNPAPVAVRTFSRVPLDFIPSSVPDYTTLSTDALYLNPIPYRNPVSASLIDPINLNGSLISSSPLTSRWVFRDGLLVNCPISESPGSSFGDFRNINGQCFGDREPARFNTSLFDEPIVGGSLFSARGPSTELQITIARNVTGRFGRGFRDTARDLEVCDCLQQNRNLSLEGMLYGNGDTQNLAQETMNENIRRINSRITGEFNAMAFQASTLSGSSVGGQAFTDAYKHNYNPPLNNPDRLPRVWTGVGEMYQSRAVAGLTAPDMVAGLTNPQPLAALFETRPGSENYNPAMCIPQRHLRAMQQLPTDEQTVNFMSQLPEAFNPDDWDFNKLRKRLRDLSVNVRTLNQAIGDPDSEARQIYLKLEFLHRNGMVKNLFSASNDLPNSRALKNDFYNRMRQTFANSTNLQSPGERFKAYRSMLVVYFGGGSEAGTLDEIQKMTQSGAEANMASLIAEIPARAASITSSRTPEEIFGDASAGTLLAQARDGIDIRDAETDPQVYRNYCPRLRFSQMANQWTVIRELEQRFDENYSSTKSKYDGLQSTVCTGRRRSATGDLKSFADFMRETCSGLGGIRCAKERHEQILARYLTNYPESESGPSDRKDVESLIPLLSGDVALADVKPGSHETARPRTPGQVSKTNNILSQIASETQDNTGMRNTTAGRNFESSTNDNAISKSKVEARPVEQLAQLNQQNQGASTAVSGVSPLIPTMQGGTPPVEAEVIRTKVRQSDSNLNRISEQLAGIRDEVVGRREAGETEQTSPQLQSLMDRLASLERTVTTETNKNSALRRQLADAEARVAAAEAPQVAPDAERTPARRIASVSGTTSGAASPEISQSSGSTGGGAAPQPQSGGGFSQVSDPVQARSVIGGRLNAALLSRYGVSSVSQQPRGSIIIAESGSERDIQQLRADSNGSVLQLSFTEADYNRFTQNEGQALEAYLSQVQSAPGEVVRVVISRPGSNETVERFILKSEGKVTIVSQPGVSRAPAGSQRYRLSDLVSELQVGR